MNREQRHVRCSMCAPAPAKWLRRVPRGVQALGDNRWIEAQASLGSIAEADRSQLICVLIEKVDAHAKLFGDHSWRDELGHCLATQQLCHPLCDGLDAGCVQVDENGIPQLRA
jgi:hypothetical protein